MKLPNVGPLQRGPLAVSGCSDVILMVFQNLSETKLMQAWNIFGSVLFSHAFCLSLLTAI